MPHRTGGEAVWVYTNGSEVSTEAEYAQLRRRNWHEVEAASGPAERYP